MDKVICADGTPIAYQAVGSGPTVILVGGAFCDHTATTELAEALAGEFTAVSYDRRGRGASGDNRPIAVQREIEDIEALIRHFGERAFLFGMSSGAALALLATAGGAPAAAVAAMEPPYRIGDGPKAPPNYTATLVELTNTGRNGDAVAYFMTKAVGQPEEAVEAQKQDPSWRWLEAMAPSLVYDAYVMGDDSALPVEQLASITVPALGVYSTASPQWLTKGAEAVGETVPNASARGLPGGFHEVPVPTLAPVLAEFYRSV